MLRLIIILFLFILFNLCWKLIAPIFIVKNNIKNKIKSNSKNNNKNLIKDLTKCATCNLYLPMEDAIHQDGKIFCCKAHANQSN